MKYSQHLKDYVSKLKTSEFMKFNPLLKRYDGVSKELVVKIDIEATERLSRILDVRTAIADIFDLNPSQIELVDLKEGCIIATFHIPIPVAEAVFNENTVLAESQWEDLQALKILWLKCNDCLLSCTAEHRYVKYRMQPLHILHAAHSLTI